VVALPQGAMFRRIGRVVDMGAFSLANVHLSHGQVLNRRQLWRIAGTLPERAAVLGDFNLVGPCMLPGFRDVGPRAATHRAAEMVPLRIDRCLVRGLDCLGTAVLGRASSDHHPIVVRLAASAERALAA
jgi:endonuclease/exonuclease/phosphatase family metal-dependent hydrolase